MYGETVGPECDVNGMEYHLAFRWDRVDILPRV